MRDLNKIEERLLADEVERLTGELRAVGETINGIFAKYPTIRGKHAADIEPFIRGIVCAKNQYFAGYTTDVNVAAERPLPDCLREVMLTHVVGEFMERMEYVAETIENSENG